MTKKATEKKVPQSGILKQVVGNKFEKPVKKPAPKPTPLQNEIKAAMAQGGLHN